MVGKIESLNEKNQGDGIFMERKGYFWMLFEHRKYLSLICVITYLFVLSLVDEFNLPSRLVLWLCEYAHYQLPFILGCVCTISVLIAMINYIGKIITTSLSDIIDRCIFICGIATLIYTVMLNLLDENSWKIYVLSAMLFLYIHIIVYRVYRYYILQNCSVSVNTNLYDLKDIYEKGVEDANPNMPILISDEAVEYDLLEREFIINNLLNDIQACQSERSFVIGLEGEWGSGKTTIVNIVKARLNKHNINKVSDANRYVVLSDFNLWLYNNNETFLLEMFDAILKASGATYSFIRRKKAELVLSELLAHNNMTSVINTLLFTPKKLGNRLQKIKRDIEQYLKCNNKVLVLFIDDIDRALPENVVFLFKALSLILDLKRTIYILSYDPKQLQHIFSTGMQIDPKYIEKIIHSRIKVDVPSATMVDVCRKCLSNILAVYSRDNNDIYDKLISCIVSNISNIREFKRMVNSILYAPMAYNTHLYKPDLLSIEYIKYANFQLYQEIYQNKIYFISCDTEYDIDVSIRTINHDEFEKEKAEFWNRLKKSMDYAPYIDIVSDLFLQNKSIYDSHDGTSDIRDNKHVAKYARICSAIYFELYFNYISNVYIEIKNDVLRFIAIANNVESADDLISAFTTSINKYESLIWFKFFILFINDIFKEKATLLAEVVFQLIYCNNKLNPSVAVECIYELLKNSEEDAVHSFCQSIHSSYSKLSIIEHIKMRTAKNIYENVEYDEVINNCYSDMCNKIITNKINLYCDENYHMYNIVSLLKFFVKNQEILHKYISSIISSKNIYRVIGDTIIGDTIASSGGFNYRYFVVKERYDLLLGGMDISSFLDDHKPITKSEKLVFEIYKKYIERDPKVKCNGEEVVLDHPFTFEL